VSFRGLVTVLFLLLLGCDEQPDKRSPFERFGFIETPVGQPLAATAIISANDVLGGRVPIVLRGAWQKAEPNDSRQVVAVYLIDGSAITSAYMVMVPTDCRCVFVQPAAFKAWMDDHTRRLPQMLESDAGAVLTFMLLHEVGHILHGDPGQFDGKTGPAALNTDITDQKERESAADLFAVEQVNAALSNGKAIGGWSSALKISLALSGLSFNMSADRVLEHFGATSLCSHAVFADSGYSHPNFELRLLVANNLLSQSAVSTELLDIFRTCRTRPPSGILFQRSD
jgi:hypothetical protein